MIKEFDDLIKLCDEMNSTNSSNAKAIILVKHPECKELIELAMNPYKKYHVTSKNIEKLRGKCGNFIFNVPTNYETFKTILNELVTGTISGHVAISNIDTYIKEVGEEYRQLVYNILDKNLKIRFGKKEVNKIWDNLIPMFNVTLAKTITDKQIENLDSSYFIQRKLDGCRCVCRYENGVISFWSRSGNEFDTLDVLRDSIYDHIEKNSIDYDFIIDGEICIIDENGNEVFSTILTEQGEVVQQGIMSYINKKGYTIEKPMYKTFDMLTIRDFDRMESDQVYSDRYTKLKKTFGKCKNLEVISSIRYTKENFDMLQEKVDTEGWEGLMVRKDVGYQGKKNSNLLKVKKFFDDEYEVISINVGTDRVISKETGLEEEIETCSSLNFLHKGDEVSAGSGLSEVDCLRFFNDPSLIIGKTICVKYFEESRNKKTKKWSLRFPVVKHVYENGRDT